MPLLLLRVRAFGAPALRAAMLSGGRLPVLPCGNTGTAPPASTAALRAIEYARNASMPAFVRAAPASAMAYSDPIPALKREVAEQIVAVLDGWSLAFASGVIGADRWRVADLRAGRLTRFSLETLIRFATRAKCGVAITVTPPRN